MTLRHIRIFKAVCDCGCNTTKAAEQLHMTQPAVSLAISELESYYKVKLFDRISRRLSLSQAGIRFLEYARTISITFDDLERTVSQWEKNGELRIGASISIGSMLMPELVSRFRKSNPDVRVRIKVDRSDRLEASVLENELDFALTEGGVHSDSLYSEDFMEDTLAVVSSSELYANGTVLTPEEFLSSELLLREHGSGTREVFDSALSACGYTPPEPSWEGLSTAALMNAAAAGLGIAVIPKRMADERVRSGQLSALSVKGIEFKRKYKIIYHKNKHLTESAKAFLCLCTAEI